MTALFVSGALVLVAEVLTIPLLLHLDTRRTWRELTDTWHGAAIEHLPETWTADAPPTELVERVAAGLRKLTGTDYVGGHRVGVAAGTPAQRQRWNTPTAEFAAIVAASYSTGEHKALAVRLSTLGAEHQPAQVRQYAAAVGAMSWPPIGRPPVVTT